MTTARGKMRDALNGCKTTGMPAISGIVRPAAPQDGAACAAIYRPYVENTAISWELEVPPVDEMAARITGLRATHEWLVLEREDQIVGFAYGQPLKRLASFQWSTETGIYMRADHQRTGGGRELYTRLLRRLTERGYRQAFAGIVKAQPKFMGLPVQSLVDAALAQPMNAVDAAIKEQDAQKFAAAYAQLTAGCNACHTAVEHPFVVIKVPDASAFPNQDFSPH